MNGRGLLLALAAVLVVAGSAFAWGGQGRPGQGPRFSGAGRWECRAPDGVGQFGGRGAMMGGGFGRFGADLPEAMQEKVLEMRKIQHEMALALMEKDVDKAKVMALHEKKMGLRNEVSKWRFEQRLNMMADEKNPMMRGGGMWRQHRMGNFRNGGWDERQEWLKNRMENRQENRQQNRQQGQPNA